MPDQSLDISKSLRFWIDSSDDDYDTMIVMYQSNRYSWSLFIGHLMIEKLLKAYFIFAKHELPPYIHKLLRLAEMSGLPLTDKQKLQLATITAFNINARYDDYKMGFQRKCTPEFTKEWINVLEELRKWIKELIKI